MKEKSDKFTFVFDNKTNNWFAIDTKSDKYKFYGRISKKKSNDDYFNFNKKKEKESN